MPGVLQDFLCWAWIYPGLLFPYQHTQLLYTYVKYRIKERPSRKPLLFLPLTIGHLGQSPGCVRGPPPVGSLWKEVCRCQEKNPVRRQKFNTHQLVSLQGLGHHIYIFGSPGLFNTSCKVTHPCPNSHFLSGGNVTHQVSKCIAVISLQLNLPALPYL